jgi:hypothetical protein
VDADHRRARPVDAGRRRRYIRAGLPWFDLDDDHLGDIDPNGVLASVGEHVVDGVW